jgi:eukaryotic-like serine/threonine-protein kinase
MNAGSLRMPSTALSLAERELRQARAELETGLRAGEDLRTEDFFRRYPAVAADTEAALELVYAEYVVRGERGETCDPAEWYQRFPQLASDLQQVFEIDREWRHEAEGTTAQILPVRTTNALGTNGIFIPGYEIVGEIGRGGMGIVYRAVQDGLQRVVSIKVILSGAYASERERQRFRREAEAIARLNHPNIVKIFDVGEADGRLYCAMEYIDGPSLAAKISKTPWPWADAAEFIATVAVALHHAHERGVVHRDLKPANILLSGDGVPHITDFGLAKLLTESDARGPTLTGDLIGTPVAMAPEQAMAQTAHIGPRTDVWALGVLMYELLTARLPFVADSTAETLDRIRNHEPVPLQELRPNLPRDLQTICLKCLNKAPEGRYDSAASLAADLQRWRRGESIVARPVGPREKAWRWCRRNPVVANLLAVAVVFIIGTVVMSGVAYEQLHRTNEAVLAKAAQETSARIQAEIDHGIKETLLQDSRRLNTRLQVEDAFRHYTNGDLSGAAVLLAHACAGDPDPAAEASHRTRLGVTLRAIPRVIRDSHALGTVFAGDPFTGDGRYLGIVLRDSGIVMQRTGEAGISKFCLDTGKQIARHLRGSYRGGYVAHVVGTKIEIVDLRTGQPATLTNDADDSLPEPFTPDGQFCAEGFIEASGWTVQQPGVFRTIRVLAADGRLVGPVIRPPERAFRGFALSPDGQWLATADQSGRVCVWNTATGTVDRELHRFETVAQAVRFDRTGQRVFAGCTGGWAGVWERTTGTPVIPQPQHGAAIEDIRISDDQKRFATISHKDASIRLWDAVSGQRIGEARHVPGGLRSVRLHPKLPEAVVVAGDDHAQVWDFANSQAVTPRLTGAKHAAYTDDNRAVATIDTENRIRVWSFHHQQPFLVSGSKIWSFWGSDDRTIITFDTRSVTVHDALKGRIEKSEDHGVSNLVNVRALGGSRWLLMMFQNGEAGFAVWDGCLKQVVKQPGKARGLVVLPDGFAWWQPDGLIFADPQGRTRGDSIPLAETTWELTATPDGRRILSKGMITRLWDAQSHRLVRAFNEVNPSRESTLTSDGRFVVALTNQRAIVRYNTMDGEAVGAPITVGSWSTKLTLSADAAWAAAVNPADHSVQVWNIASGNPRGTILPVSAPIAMLMFDPTNQRLAVGLSDGTCQVWDTERAQPLTPTLGRGRELSRLSFSPDGQSLLIAYTDRVWLVDLRPDPRSLDEIRVEAETLARRKLDARGVLVPHTSR